MEYLNLNKICRACLLEREHMKKMTDLCNQKSLMEMFVAVTNVEVQEVDLSQLCDQCEEKLNLSYGFREQCQRSNEILLNYTVPDNKVIEVDSQNTKELEVKLEESDGERNAEPCEPKRRSKRQKAKQHLRLTQFSYDEVNQAIEEARKKFFENTECIRCGFVGSNARALSVHISHLHKDLKQHWCTHCNGEFENLEEHLKLHGDADLKCQFCEKVFQAKGHLTEHLRSHSVVRPYKCDFCEKCFISQRHLRVHFRIHTDERPYQCQLCPRAFIQQTSLKSHLKQHEKGGIEDIKEENGQEGNENRSEKLTVIAQNYCTDCNRKVRSLSLHRRQVHSDGIKILNEYGDNLANNKLCTVCGKQFKNSSKLKVHMRVHTGEAPYKCSYCGKRVTTRNQLVVHERIHTGEKPHVCHVCGKGFAQSSVLNTHMKLHTGRPEVCQICDQRFCRPAELKLHMRKHTGEKPFLCTECGQAFIQRSHLVEHNKTHSDDRPYQCSYCTKAFKQNSSLKSHVQIHLGWKPFKCSQCSYACRQSYSLTQHMKQHENDAPRLDRPHMCMLCSKTFTTVAMLTSHTDSVHNVNNTLFD